MYSRITQARSSLLAESLFRPPLHALFFQSNKVPTLGAVADGRERHGRFNFGGANKKLFDTLAQTETNKRPMCILSDPKPIYLVFYLKTLRVQHAPEEGFSEMKDPSGCPKRLHFRVRLYASLDCAQFCQILYYYSSSSCV